MSSLSAVEAQLPPGFRFHPRDEELICDYLMKWVTGNPNQRPFLIEVDLNKCEPWDIPEVARIGGKEWYFYSQRDQKYATGLRKNRATVSGYWKATGKDRPAIKNGTLVGMRKTLVFYQGRAPKGRKTEWILHEFRLERNMESDPKTFIKVDWVLCRVFYKNRSEATTSKQEKAFSTSYSPSLPPLMEPYFTLNNPTHEPDLGVHHYQEQVPCFSIFTANQTNPNNNFPFLNPSESILPSTKIMPTNFEETLSDPGIYTSHSMNCSGSSSCDNTGIIRAVLNHITRMDPNGAVLKESPSSGEGNSDSYLSGVFWNQYS